MSAATPRRRYGRGEWIARADRTVLSIARLLNYAIVAGVLGYFAWRIANVLARGLIAWWLS